MKRSRSTRLGLEEVKEPSGVFATVPTQKAETLAGVTPMHAVDENVINFFRNLGVPREFGQLIALLAVTERGRDFAQEIIPRLFPERDSDHPIFAAPRAMREPADCEIASVGFAWFGGGGHRTHS
jgi:hypothetical protein